MKTETRHYLLRNFGIPIALCGIAVLIGVLHPILGVLAAVGLVVQGALGEGVGRFLFARLHDSHYGIYYWLIFSLGMGIAAGIGLATVWGSIAGVAFGLFLGMLLLLIGYLESRGQ